MRQHTIVASRALLAIPPLAAAYDVTDKLSINGVLSGAGQCQFVSDTEADDKCRGAISFQPDLSFRPTETDEFFTKCGFAVDNALNDQPPFNVAPWAADLEDDVEDINGRNRDYLLTAWYKHTFTLGEKNTLAPTLGIIDSSDYLDQNAYAEDEYTQFMNETFVSDRGSLLPAYDAGAALEWDVGAWSVSGVVMNVGENDDGHGYNFYGAQLAYAIDTALGEGNYRVAAGTTNKRFLDASGTSEERRVSVLLNFDQQFSHHLGAFLRLAWQDDDAAVDYDGTFSGGISINGGLWNRVRDNVGVAYGYLNGGNQDLDKTQVAEIYYRLVMGDNFALTADVQYMKDEMKEGSDEPKSWILGLRATADF